ncbi:hypothetical protein B0H13DRAFT_2655064 [Mycena leptocephala]|nr:hypothetical protein B0H13DRAFT_2655064 [Mycena leptocephala]
MTEFRAAKGLLLCPHLFLIPHHAVELPMLVFPPLLGALLLTALSAAGQQPSAFWRKPNITTSPADRVSIAGAAIEKALNRLGTDGQFTGEDYIIAGNFYYQMAEFDIVSNGTQYRDALQRYFPLAQTNRGNFTDTLVSILSANPELFVHYGLSYGYAAARAYVAYKDRVFLQYAVESWWFGRTYTLSQADIDAGKIGVKNFSVPALCQGATMVGGTFYSTDTGDTAINGLPTGYFAVLSAILAEATADPMYLQAAQQSTEFIRAHLVNNQNIAQDGMSGRASDSCLVSSIIEPYNSGLMMEGLATIASIHQDASTRNLLATIIQAAIVDTAWQGSNGIIANVGHGNGGDIYLVRGLGVAYSRNQTSPALHTYIQDYLAVQFNAILDLSTSGASDIYGGPWIGPPSATFSGGAQTLALSGLIAAISLNNGTEHSTVSSTSATASSASSSATVSFVPAVHEHPPPIGAIAGGFNRQQNKNLIYTDGHVQREPPMSEPAIRPFTVPSSPPSTVTAATSSVPSPPVSPQGYPNSKRARHLASPTTDSSRPSTSIATLAQESSPAIPSTAEVGRSRSPSAMPTEALVRLLNQRLQNQQWDEEEAPPVYPALSDR